MENYENFCMRCMNDKGDLKKCPYCGYVDSDDQSSKLVEKRVILQGKYIVGNKISESSESICYIGYDIKNKSRIHIREFFPADICLRSDDGHTVIPKDSCTEKYEELKEDFLLYFRNLAKVRGLEAVVSLYDIFIEYGTAYIISEVVDGISLYSLIKKNGRPLEWDTARILFMPVLSALNKLNNAGIYHLGISPETLIIGKDGRMHISGFSTMNLRQNGVYSVCGLYRGFAAPEQYIKGCEITRAADVYGFTASWFFALVGFEPKDASERDIDDRLLIPVKILKNIPPHVVSALANGLNVNAKKRTDSFDVLRDELTETSAKYLKEQNDVLEEIISDKNEKNKNAKWIVGSALIFILILFGAAFLYSHFNSNNKNVEQDELTIQETNIDGNITVPDFVGRDYEELKNNDSENDDYMIYLSEKIFDDNIEEGKVISQTPQAGLSVKKGSNIVLTVSKGPKVRELPQIEGLSLPYVSELLAKSGFIPTKIDEYSNEIIAGSVIGYKDHKAGDKLEYGSEVKIIVSKGQL